MRGHQKGILKIKMNNKNICKIQIKTKTINKVIRKILILNNPNIKEKLQVQKN